MQSTKQWTIAEASEQARQLADSLKTSPLIAQMLLNRGVVELEECRRFLSPSLKLLHSPDLMPGLAAAAGRIAQAIRDGQKIVIYGDYDVDGITATAILWHAITLLGGTVSYYIPHRLEEGYGLNAEAIGQICDQGAKLIVTVDCGITAIEPAKVAAQRGVDLIITDHHDWKSHGPASPGAAPVGGEESGPALPPCLAIVHPRLPIGGGYPNPNLCGAGVAFKLAWGIGQAHGGAVRVSQTFRNFLLEAMALAALGTIADVVPLTGENRLLAHFGLGGLAKSNLLGIKALIESAHLTGQKLDSYHVGFLMAPRLNACGRMGHAREAVEMLTSADAVKAKEIAVYLEQQNRLRQSMEREILTAALAQAQSLKYDSDDARGIVLGAEGWHPGVIGIVAARIVSRLNRPTVMVALSNGHGQGSGRSIPGFHLAKALDACRAHLDGCGGHEMAAGLRLQSDKFPAFRAAFADYARQMVSSQMLVPQLHLDCQAELGQITAALVTDLHRLGPFGTANRKPLLCCAGLQLTGVPRRVGKAGEHLQLMVRQGNARMKCVAFNFAHWLDRLHDGVTIDLAVEPIVNEFNGRRSVELEVKDIRLPG